MNVSKFRLGGKPGRIVAVVFSTGVDVGDFYSCNSGKEE
jgi:hypothetical protein